MTRRHPLTLRSALCVALLLAGGLGVTAQLHEPVDLDAIYKIKEEGLERSQVMNLAWWMTEVHGPRLTNSPQQRRASEWAATKARELGLSNVAIEPWGEFGRGWSNTRTVVHVVEPTPWPVLAYARAWTPGTGRAVTAGAVVAVITEDADFEKYRGTLKDRVVLLQPARPVAPLFEAPAQRLTTDALDAMTLQVVAPGGGGPGGGFAQAQAFQARRHAFLLSEGVVAVLEPGFNRGDSGSVLVAAGGPRNPADPPVPPQLAVATEHYNRLVRLVENGVPVTLEVDVRNTFHDEDLTAHNVIAEIPGTDKANELVMLGAHFDSWHAGTGSVDNASGSAVMLEAMRILKATGLPMRRTVRMALWTGEEQGLLGSRAYVRQHFADPATMALKPAHATLSAYFNMDNGTGQYRGVHLQGNEAIAPIFRAWMAPFANLGMTHLTIRNTGGTDHLAYDAVGLPGFQFIQDPIQYGSRTHHSNLDLYDQLIAADLMKNAVITAAFVYHAANRDALLPRKTLPRAPTPSAGGRP
ncbi:MAG: M20/M25/M40 family metallo-hydrolase [Vicinamibacterales bacterium]|nr:M20/M25/M40 family metallo-hydrolase [Vicinamibacterales bacterium]